MRYVAGMIVLIAAVLGAGLVARAQESVDASTLPFSAARQAGHTLYLSGQIPVTPDGEVVRGTVGEQTRQAMKNLEAALTENGYGWDDVVKVTVFLNDMKNYQEMNAAYRAFFTHGFPARECVGGLQVAFGTDLEISCIAYKE